MLAGTYVWGTLFPPHSSQQRSCRRAPTGAVRSCQRRVMPILPSCQQEATAAVPKHQQAMTSRSCRCLLWA